MKVTEIRTFVVGNPPPRFGGRYFVFLKLTTDSGITGIGEVYTATFSPSLVAAMVEDVAARHVIGHDPFRIETMWRAMYGRGFALRPDLTLGGIMSGLEMACWDIIGKELGKPVYELLGGRVHDRLRTYTYLYPPDGVLEDSQSRPLARRQTRLLPAAHMELRRGDSGPAEAVPRSRREVHHPDPARPSGIGAPREFANRLRPRAAQEVRRELRHSTQVNDGQSDATQQELDVPNCDIDGDSQYSARTWAGYGCY